MKYDTFELVIMGIISFLIFMFTFFGSLLFWPDMSNAAVFGICYISVTGGILTVAILDHMDV